MSHQDEIERIKQLRDRQLAARDPLAHDNRLQHKISQQHRHHRKIVTFNDVLERIPWKVWGAMVGALAGLVVWVVLTLVWESSWVDLIGIAGAVILAITGVIIGQAFDVRDELRDLIH